MTVVAFAGTQTTGPSVPSGAYTSGPAAASVSHTASPAVAPGAEPGEALQLFWDWTNQQEVSSRRYQLSPELHAIYAQLW